MTGRRWRSTAASFSGTDSDVTIVAWGAMVREALAAAASLAEAGIKVEVSMSRRLSRSMPTTILASVKKTGRCIIAHEAPLTAGFGGEIAARVAEQALLFPACPYRACHGL